MVSTFTRSLTVGIVAAGLLLAAAGCRQAAPPEAETTEAPPEAAEPATGVLTAALATDLPAPTLASPPTLTPLPTALATVTATPTATPTSTPTPAYGFYPPAGRELADLEQFWNGEAEWVLEVADTGLPIGESDTVYVGDGKFWSYLHASFQSAGVMDQCGDPVEFPGCTTRWQSDDAGQSFTLEEPVCLFECAACPCENRRDHIAQQQYPRVFFTEDAGYLAYEFGAYDFLRTTADGLNWSEYAHVEGTWIWTYPYGGCAPYELIGSHPNIYANQEWDCLAGGPPGIYVDGETLYLFVGMGKAPGHMGCYKGDRRLGAAGMVECDNNPLFGADLGYGPVELFGAEANPYFEYRTISSADVVRVGDHYYMSYEGVRGPSNPAVVDNQFALGLARSVSLEIDGPWEKYPDNPIIRDLPGDVGLGHADIVLVDGATYLYTSTDEGKRGRYLLLLKQPDG